MISEVKRGREEMEGHCHPISVLLPGGGDLAAALSRRAGDADTGSETATVAGPPSVSRSPGSGGGLDTPSGCVFLPVVK